MTARLSLKVRANARPLFAILAEVGATDARIEDGGKHPKLVYCWKGRERFYVLSGTSSDPNISKVQQSDLRRILGLTGGPKRVGARRQRKRRKTHQRPAECPELTFRENPFDVLADVEIPWPPCNIPWI